MKKKTLLKVILTVTLLGLLFISFCARDLLIDWGWIDYSGSEIERQFNANRESFVQSAEYLETLGDGEIIPTDSSRYVREKSFGDNISSEMRPVFNSVLTKYFSRIKYLSDPFMLAVYSANGRAAIVYDSGEPLKDGLKKELGDNWYLYERKEADESADEEKK